MVLKPVDTAIIMIVGPLIDSTDFKTLEEAIAYNAAGMDISLIIEKTDGTSTTTTITLTTGGTSDWTHKDGGYYEVEITAAQNAEEGIAYVRGVCTGVLPFESPRYEIVKANIYDSLVKGTDTLDTTNPDIIIPIPNIPNAINLSDSATVRIGIGITNAIGNLPTTTEITPGTIHIYRKAIGGTSWVVIVNGATCSESNGLIYYDEVFDTISGYAAGNSIKIIFAGQKVTVNSIDHDITSDGWTFYTYIREEMRGTDSAALASGVNTTQINGSALAASNLYDFAISGYDSSTNKITGCKVNDDMVSAAPTVTQIRQEMDTNSTDLNSILGDTNELQLNQGNWATAVGFSTHSAADIWSVGTRALTDKSEFGLSSASINLIWDDLISGMTAVGSIGKLIADNLNATITSRAVPNEYDIQMGYIPSNLGDVPIASELNSVHGAGSWATATGFSTHSAANVWSVTTRILTANTNFNDLSTTDINTEVATALAAIKLDHLINIAVDTNWATTVHLDSVIGQLADVGTSATFDRTTDSQEAIRDRGDAAWVTGGGGAINDILNIQTLIPYSIDLANTAIIRIGLGLTNMVDNLPTTTEITPGTITIDRKAIGGTSWINKVNASACSELTGLIYYDEVFDNTTGYVAGDSIRITFKSQKITVDANDFEITGTDGWVFQTHIRESMVGTTGANTTTPPTVGDIRTEMEGVGSKILAIEGDTNDLQTNQGDWLTATGFSTHTAANVWSVATRSLTDKSGFSLSTAGIKAIWDQATNLLTTVGSLGKLLVDNINATISSRNSTVPDAAGTAATLHGTTDDKIDVIDAIVDTIKSKTDNLPSGITKNEALPKFDFLMVLANDHVTGATGKTITGTISKDGGAFTAITNTITEVSNGMYTIASGFTQTEMNADVITFQFNEDACDPRIITILTN
jgi:hypothetical protein